MTNIKERILKVCENKGIHKELFFSELGLSYSNFKGAQKKTALNSDAIDKIVTKYPDINLNWLISNKGDMYESQNIVLNEVSSVYKTKNADKIHDNQDVPLYDILASASVVSLFKNPSSTEIIDTIHIPNMPKCDGAIVVTGDSMYPLIKSGDIVFYKTISDLNNSVLFGNMYIISVDIEGDEMLLVKYIHKGKDQEHLTLVSENKYHADKEIHIKHVLSMALVKGNVRFNFTT